MTMSSGGTAPFYVRIGFAFACLFFTQLFLSFPLLIFKGKTAWLNTYRKMFQKP
jgi:hypothetical protein